MKRKLRIYAANSAELETDEILVANMDGGDAVFTVSEDGLFIPYGDYPHSKGLQKFTKASAEKMVAAWNSLSEKVRRVFTGIPVYVGHPDVPDLRKFYSDTKAYGWVEGVEAENDGLRLPVKWTAAGKQLVEGGHYKFYSPYWILKRIAGGLSPIRLLSVGLTNNNNIPVPALANTDEKPTANEGKIMNKLTKEQIEYIANGDYPGHPFHGNQWTGGLFSEHDAEHHSDWADAHSHIAARADETAKTTRGHMNAAQAHKSAAEYHRTAAAASKEEGATDREKYHNSMAKGHDAIAKVHAKAAWHSGANESYFSETKNEDAEKAANELAAAKTELEALNGKLTASNTARVALGLEPLIKCGKVLIAEKDALSEKLIGMANEAELKDAFNELEKRAPQLKTEAKSKDLGGAKQKLAAENSAEIRSGQRREAIDEEIKQIDASNEKLSRTMTSASKYDEAWRRAEKKNPELFGAATE